MCRAEESRQDRRLRLDRHSPALFHDHKAQQLRRGARACRVGICNHKRVEPRLELLYGRDAGSENEKVVPVGVFARLMWASRLPSRHRVVDWRACCTTGGGGVCWAPTAANLCGRGRTGRIYPPIDALPELATRPYPATQHDAWDCPQLGASLIAGHRGRDRNVCKKQGANSGHPTRATSRIHAPH
jgi:hypothetical protein